MSTSKFAGELLQTAVTHNIEHLQEAVERFIIYHNRNDTLASEIKQQFEKAFAPLEAFVENLDEQRKIIRAHTNAYFVSGNLMAKLGFEDLELEDYLEAQAEAAEAPRAPTADEHFAAFEAARRIWLKNSETTCFQQTFLESWRAGDHAPGYRPKSATIIMEHDQRSDAFAVVKDDIPAFLGWYALGFRGPNPDPAQNIRDYFTENGVTIHTYI